MYAWVFFTNKSRTEYKIDRWIVEATAMQVLDCSEEGTELEVEALNIPVKPSSPPVCF